MLSYTVKYRFPNQFSWTTIKNVKNDGFITHLHVDGIPTQLTEPIRFLCTIDNKMIHLPFKIQIIFGPERDAIITKRLSQQAGQSVQRHED